MVTETAANSIKTTKVFSPFAISDGKQCTWSSSTVNGNSESYAIRVNLFFEKCHVCPSVLYFPKVGQIQHSAIKINMKIKAHFNL